MFKRAFAKRLRSTLSPSAAATPPNAVNVTASHKVPPTAGLEFLSTLPVRFAAVVDVPRFRVRQVRRRLEIRANYAVILKRPSVPTQSGLDRSEIVALFDLPIASSTRLSTSRSITIAHMALTLTFQTDAEALSFRTLLPTQSHSSPPSKLQSEFLMDLPVLGQGASAIVRRLSSDTAVKLIPKHRVYESDNDLSHLIAERRAYSNLRACPFVLKLRSAWQTKTHFALVTDLAHYGDLHQVQMQLPNRRFPSHIARRLFAELVVSLDTIHARGWLYRDMKPSNVLLTRDGHIRLADLGLMKQVAVDKPHMPASSSVSSATSTSDDDTESDGSDSGHDAPAQGRLVAASSFVGTRRFMSPEVYGQPGRQRAYGQSADLWSLGVTLYVLLTGLFPFDGSESDQTTLSLSVRHDEVDVSTLDSEVADLIRKMLCKDPLERISLAEIKEHPWLKDISWNSVRLDGILKNRPSPIVKYLRESGVLDVDERAASRNSSDANRKGSVISQVSDKVSVDKSAISADWDLLGFEHLE